MSRWTSTTFPSPASPSSSSRESGRSALDEAADYLEMAARLLRIKAQMLLPRLRARTRGRTRAPNWCGGCSNTSRCARWLTCSSIVARNVDIVLSRAGCHRPRTSCRRSAPLALNLNELLAAVDRVLRAAKHPMLHEVVPRAIDIGGAMRTIRALLALRRQRAMVRPRGTRGRTVAGVVGPAGAARNGEVG